jgi:hypothetical protein
MNEVDGKSKQLFKSVFGSNDLCRIWGEGTMEEPKIVEPIEETKEEVQ